jgi:hypothetical protein
MTYQCRSAMHGSNTILPIGRSIISQDISQPTELCTELFLLTGAADGRTANLQRSNFCGEGNTIRILCSSAQDGMSFNRGCRSRCCLHSGIARSFSGTRQTTRLSSLGRESSGLDGGEGCFRHAIAPFIFSGNAQLVSGHSPSRHCLCVIRL